MNTTTHGKEFLSELEMEMVASRKCVERIPENLFHHKPHETSMEMGYLAVIVAEIPKWLAVTAEIGEVNFATWERYTLTTSADLLRYFDENIVLAKKALSTVSDETLEKMFYLKMGEQTLMSSTRKESIGSSINHLVHHRGQLTVYMRLNGIAVPSLYGPSADEKTF
jgi:uncharacterized damage-inducible protein DinB